MKFLSITADEKLAHLAAAVVMRESEIMHYQVNIDNYTAMLAALPAGTWPENLASYKTLALDKIAEQVASADLQAVSDLLHRDKLAALLVTEKLEQGKSIRVLNALLAQLPAKQAQALVDAAKAKLLAQK